MSIPAAPAPCLPWTCCLRHKKRTETAIPLRISGGGLLLGRRDLRENFLGEISSARVGGRGTSPAGTADKKGGTEKRQAEKRDRKRR